ncbi:hypothetical protein [Cupriavidus basilensis]|jgi:hypothetical protein|uniref:hypothetical protein n=1 Tax=Cupriavidus basilensis TaxID=68895 RepID=UPI0023E85B60|nr:hypothetical protein [Cupriavidus basilensis]MDF3881086.1 hypothetical protein [Cupriavidus basilensis]
MQQNNELNEPVPRVIKLAPSWRGILLGLLAAYRDGTRQGEVAALAELQRMAVIADHARTARAKLQEIVDAFPQFDVSEDSQDSEISSEVNGGDAVQWLGQFRAEVKEFLATPPK